jgi:hypothetical protein
VLRRLFDGSGARTADPDEHVIAALRQSGADLAKPMIVNSESIRVMLVELEAAAEAAATP